MNSEGVILLHGIFRTKRSMQRLADFLESQGYKTLNLGYPSTRHALENLVQHIHPRIAKFSDSVSRLHIVGYSMGGLLARAYIHRFRPNNLGRVVMLGVPNQGSEVADFCKDWRLYKLFYGPAGQQLVTNPGLENVLGKVDYELGVIAGNRTIDPLGSYLIGRPNDGKVSIESTKLPGMKDHTVIATNHTFFPSNKRAWQLTLHFLRSGVLGNK